MPWSCYAEDALLMNCVKHRASDSWHYAAVKAELEEWCFYFREGLGD